MDSEALKKHLEQHIRLVLTNGFWYTGKILSIGKESITFLELKGRILTITPSMISLCEPLEEKP